MKAVITRDIEVRHPSRNAALSLRAGEAPQTLPSWAIEEAARRGAASVVEKPKRSTRKGGSASGAASEEPAAPDPSGAEPPIPTTEEQ